MRGKPPYSSVNTKKNLARATEYSKVVVEEGHTPITPHLYFQTFIDDQVENERARGIEMGKQLLLKCDEVWVFEENGISEGMKAEIELASNVGIPVRFK